MEKITFRKLRAGVLALSAGFLLAGCDPVSAAPKSYKDPIVVRTADGSKVEFDENILGNLYDSITSERNSKVVSTILEKIAEDKFGSFHQILEASSDPAKKAELVKKDYYKGETARFDKFFAEIEKRLSEHFYNQITSSSYNDDLGRFSEEKFYKACKYELYDMVAITGAVKENKFFVDASITKENAIGKLKGQYYNNAEGARGYIEEKVYPEILKNMLVEDYIYEKNTSSLGRAYAREVSFVKISYEDSFKYEKALMQSFADRYVKNGEAVSETAPEELPFDLMNDVIKGFSVFEQGGCLVREALPARVADLMDDTYGIGYETVEVPAAGHTMADYTYEGYTLVEAGVYAKESKLGQILESYEKGLEAEGNRFAPEELKSELEKFTSDGKSKEYGLMQKLVSLAKEDYTTDGWYVKNGGISELPSALRDRLFNIKVANTLDKIAPEATPGDYEKSSYLRNINGRKVILPSNASPYSESEPFNYVYHDVDGKAFYICQVLEAPSTGKLDKNKTTDYSTEEKEDISREVAKVLGTKDSYIKDAYTEYLKEYNFEFFDTSLYEYFKSEYPDLPQFEDD